MATNGGFRHFGNGRKSRSRRSPYRVLRSEALEERQVLATSASMLLDINKLPYSLTDVGEFTALDNTLYFTADDGAHGRELWKSDGTPTGTQMVRDLSQNEFGEHPYDLRVFNGLLYFQRVVSIDNDTSETQLWKTDGTSDGTVLVRSIIGTNNDSGLGKLTVAGTKLYFSAYDATNGRELWVSDGTTDGTQLVRDLRPGNSASSETSLLGAIGETIYFVGRDSHVGNRALWKSDGTSAGTEKVHTVDAGFTAENGSATIGGVLYFQGFSGTVNHGGELWRTDGTTAGTYEVRDLVPGGDWMNIRNWTQVNNTLLFTVETNELGFELWRSDGTTDGTHVLRDIAPGSEDGWVDFFGSRGRSAIVNGILYFGAMDNVNGWELWRTDGTTDGTWLVRDIVAGANGSGPVEFANVGGTLYFAAEFGSQGRELWKSDGSSAGTMLVREIRGGNQGSNPSLLTDVGGTLYFTADDGVNGLQIWKSNGTSAGTTIVSSFPNTFTMPSDPGMLTTIGNNTYFAANDGIRGQELWKYDGSRVTMVRDLTTGDGQSDTLFYSFVNFNGTLYFTARVNSGEIALWKTDGTSSGTKLVYEGVGFFPQSFVAAGGELYFSNNNKLWKTNGTAGGTGVIRDVVDNTDLDELTSPQEMTAVGSTLFLVAETYLLGGGGQLIEAGGELWKTNGTTGGTQRVREIYPGDGRSEPRHLTNVGGTLYFTADDGVHGRALWKSDGSEAGTVMVKDFGNVDPDGPQNLINVAGTLYFTLVDGTGNVALWKSDGTTAGTIIVRNLGTATIPMGVDFVAVGGTLYFIVQDAAAGEELWKSNGTEAGTMMVRDLRPGDQGSRPTDLTAAGGKLFFVAEADPDQGRKVWQTDGTSVGTVMVYDGEPLYGYNGGFGANRLVAGPNGLLFHADDNMHGAEPWIVQLPSTTYLEVAVQPPGTVTAGAAFGITVQVFDKSGNFAADFNGNVTLTLLENPGGAKLGGTTTVKAINGTATFNNLTLNKTGAGYKLQAAASGTAKTTSAGFNVAAGAAASLAIVTQPPKSVGAGSVFGIIARAIDAFGNLATGFNGNVSAAIVNNPGGATLGGTTTVTAVNGQIVFDNLTLEKLGKGYTIQLTGLGATPPVTIAVEVKPGAATQLVVVLQPPAVLTAGAGFKITITAQDAFGNVASAFADAVTLVFGANPGGGTLIGTLVRKASRGTAKFSNLKLDKIGDNYTLQGSGGGLQVVTAALNVVAAKANKLIAVLLPGAIAAGVDFNVSVTVTDKFGNVVSSYANNVTISLASKPGGGVLGGGLLSVLPAGGTAAFVNLRVNVAGAYKFKFSGAGLRPLTIGPINVV